MRLQLQETEMRKISITTKPWDNNPRYYSADGAVSGHLDCRFSNEKNNELVWARLIALLGAWSRFSEQYDIENWIAHGTLLGWYWNKTIMDFDEDLDISMTRATLVEKLLRWNGTIFEGRYLIDVNPAGVFEHPRQPINDIGNPKFSYWK